MAVSEAKKQQWRAEWTRAIAEGRDPLQDAAARLEKWKADPLAHSTLPYWLNLEAWTVPEGLQVLAGIEPGSVDSDVPPCTSLEDHEDDDWRSAQPFEEHFSFSVLPEPSGLTKSDFGGDAERYEDYLQRCEARQVVLQPLRRLVSQLHHKLEHSPSALGEPIVPGKWRPVTFISWALSIGYRPKWHEWADRNGLLPDPLDAMAAPYFDVDGDDYPALLHIAVRAWEVARHGTTGTPKQRVLGFLAERYPDLPQSTKDAIALVTNWQKVGGRPKTKKGA